MQTAFDISTSALVAQRTRINTIAGNIANISTTRNEQGEPVPYQPRYVIFQTDDDLGGPVGASGVKVESVQIDKIDPRLKYQPSHPDANEDGYVAYPNVDLTTEMVDALEATRAYEANVGVMQVTKDLGQQTLRILA